VRDLGALEAIYRLDILLAPRELEQTFGRSHRAGLSIAIDL
jgi:hypothetical protein